MDKSRRQSLRRTTLGATARCERLEPRQLLSTTYYLSPSGSDSNGGTSAAAPWRSISKINLLDLEAGDQVLFEGGATFTEPDVPVSLVNPGFESGTTGWDENFGSSQALTGIGHDGLRALRVGIGEGGMGQTITHLVQPNTTYTFALWARVSNAFEWGYAGVTFKDEFGNVIHNVSMVVGGSSYSRFARSFVSPSSFAFCDIWAYKFAGVTTPFFMDVDDFSLVQNTNTIFLDANDAGSSQNPVTVGSYGAGRATINANSGQGLFAYNVGGVLVNDLNFTGAGPDANQSNGISFFMDLPGSSKLDFLRVEDVTVSGFGDTGISIGGWFDTLSTSGYRDVRVTRAVVQNNGKLGIHVWGPSLYSNENVTISDCRVDGTSGQGGSGDGILMGSTLGGTIERNIVHDNGALGTGAIGVRTYNSMNLVVQFNESYHNRTSGVIDGGGFALDWGTTDSVMQYNYSHGNDGSGYLLSARANTAVVSGNTIRYNISENDGRKNDYAGIHIWNQDVAIVNSHVYNNTVYISSAVGSTPKGIWLQTPTLGAGTAGTAVALRNNVVFAASGTRLVEVAGGQTGMFFQGNNYWSGGASFDIDWQGVVYNSLPAWRAATGQETDGVADTGFSVDPMLTAPGTGGTIGDPASLSSLSAYRTKSGSPMRDSAIDLAARYGISPGSRDFYGNSIPQGSGFDIGAHEADVGVAAPQVIASAFVYETAPQRLSFNFDRDVSASLGLDDIQVQPIGAAFSVQPTGLSYDANTNTATFSFTGILPNANYRATLLAAEITSGGVSMAANHVLDFFFLNGDANHDRSVDVADLGILASNWQQSPRTFSQGNFDYSPDGLVDVADLGILASQWQQSLALPSAPAPASGRARPARVAARAIDLLA
jgi:hypothetical protein